MAQTHADIVFAASRDALRKTERLENAVGALAASADPGDPLEEARESLDEARRAYRQIEVAVFYTDEENPGELLSLPDPDNSSRLSGARPNLSVLKKLIDSHPSVASEDSQSEGLKDPEQIVTEALVGQTHEFRISLDRFVDAWSRDMPSNFRGRYFLASPRESIRRIFQGNLTMISSVLPDRKEDLSTNLLAMRNLYLGTYQSTNGSLISGPGIRSLLEQRNSVVAEAIDSAFLESAESARRESLESGAEEGTSRSMDNLKTQWLKAASVLGLEVEVTGENRP